MIPDVHRQAVLHEISYDRPDVKDPVTREEQPVTARAWRTPRTALTWHLAGATPEGLQLKSARPRLTESRPRACGYRAHQV